MPVVLAPGVILVALAMLALALVCTIIVMSLLEKIRFEWHGFTLEIPYRDRIARAVEHAWREWLEPHMRTLTGWIDNVATHLREFPREVADFATALNRRLYHYVHTRAHQVIQAFLRPVRTLANEAKVLAAAATAAVVDLRADARAWVDGLRDTARGWVGDLRHDVGVLLGNLHRALDAAIDQVRHTVYADVLPRVGVIEDAIPGLREADRAIRNLLDEVRAWALPIAAVFSGAAALELLRHVHGCRAGTNRLCLADPSFLDELLGLTVILASMSELRAFVRTTAPFVGGLAEEFLDRT